MKLHLTFHTFKAKFSKVSAVSFKVRSWRSHSNPKCTSGLRFTYRTVRRSRTIASNSLPDSSVQGVRGSAPRTALQNLLMQSTSVSVESSSSPARGRGEGSGSSVWIVLLGGGNFPVQTVTQSCSRSSSLEGSFRTSDEFPESCGGPVR